MAFPRCPSETPSNEPEEPPWKQDLRLRFERWLASIGEDPAEPPLATSPPEKPDLYAFHADLTVLASEFRRANRRSAEAMKQWSELLHDFHLEVGKLQTRLETPPAQEIAASGVSRPHCLALVGLSDRLHRLEHAFNRPPARTWFARDGAWREAWEKQRQAFGMLALHFQELMKLAGIRPIPAVRAPFDPKTMTAVASATRTDLPHYTVIEEVLPGYQVAGEVLRLAEVKVSIPASGIHHE